MTFEFAIITPKLNKRKKRFWVVATFVIYLLLSLLSAHFILTKLDFNVGVIIGYLFCMAVIMQVLIVKLIDSYRIIDSIIFYEDRLMFKSKHNIIRYENIKQIIYSMDFASSDFIYPVYLYYKFHIRKFSGEAQTFYITHHQYNDGKYCKKRIWNSERNLFDVLKKLKIHIKRK